MAPSPASTSPSPMMSPRPSSCPRSGTRIRAGPRRSWSAASRSPGWRGLTSSSTPESMPASAAAPPTRSSMSVSPIASERRLTKTSRSRHAAAVPGGLWRLPVREEAMSRAASGLIGATAASGAALLGLFAAVGWFGGPLFTFVPARAAPAPAVHDVAAVLLSGDMGFHIGMAGAVASKLAAAGIPVVGVNSLTFFRTRRSPAETARLLATAISRALYLTHRPRILLVGQSYGADVLPIGYAGVAAPLRARVTLLALVVPGERVALQASPADVLPVSAPSRDALPAAARLGATRTLCVFGAEQRDSLCARLHLPNLTRIALPGGHYLHRDSGAVARALLAGLAL